MSKYNVGVNLTTVSGNKFITDNENNTGVIVNGDLEVLGEFKLKQGLTLTGDTKFDNLDLLGYLNVGGKTNLNILNVLNVSTFNSIINNGITTLNGNIIGNKNLNIAGNTVLNTLTANSLVVNTTSNLKGNTTIGNTLNVTGNTTLSTLTTTGLTTANSLVVNTTTTLEGNTNTKNLDVDGYLTTPSISATEGTFVNIQSNDLNAIGIQTDTLNVNNDADINNNLSVNGNESVAGALTVDGTTTLNGVTKTKNLNVTGDETINGNLSVTGDATFKKKATFNNGYKSNAISTTTTPDEGASSNEVVTAEWVKGYLQKVISSL